jgi:hypothetical protein
MNQDSIFILPVEDEPCHAGIVPHTLQYSSVSNRRMKVSDQL